MNENFSGKTAVWNAVLALGLTALFFAGTILLYEYTYGVIDDAFIATVLNGAWTGTPDAHVVYIKYPLAFLLKSLFQILPGIQWHFLLLEGCFAVCVFTVNYRICSHVKKIVYKILFCILFLLLFWLCMAKMILTAHYSMCAATLTAAGIFCFATIPGSASRKTFILNGAAILFMLWTAYAIRARTLFMLLPLAGVVFLYKFFGNRPYFRKQNILRWLSIPVILFIGLGGLELMHNAQYKSEDWQAFLRFNDARTTLYDFYGLPEFEENRELYESLGISEAREYMYEKYYLELTDGTEEDFLPAIADAAVEEFAQIMPFGKRLAATLRALPYNLTLKTYSPVNWICGISFIIIMLIAAVMRKWRIFLTVLGGAALSLVPWIWMIYMKKPTSRVTMGIWAADILFLLAVLVDNSEEIGRWFEKKGKKKKAAGILGCVAAAVFSAALIAGIAAGYGKIMKNQNKAIHSGQIRSALEEWCEQRPDNLYICESDLLNGLGFDLQEIDNNRQNLIWPGGWPAQMPLMQEIWTSFGFQDVEKAIAENENVYIIAFTETDMSYLLRFYREQFPDIRLEREEEIVLMDTPFTVYSLQ